MRPASLVAALLLSAAIAAAQAQEMQTVDADQRMARLGLIGKAERIVHRGEPYVLVSIRAQDVRVVDRPDGKTDWQRYKDRGLAFLPVEVACDAITLAAGGRRQEAHLLSPCSGPTRIAHPFAVPLFVVFRDPGPGNAAVTIPVTVLAPERPIQTRRDAAPLEPVIARDMLGARELVLNVLVSKPQR